MKQLSIKSNGHEFLLVEVPKDSYNYELHSLRSRVWYYCDAVSFRQHTIINNIKEGDLIVGTFNPSTGENTTELPTELLHSETTKMFPLTRKSVLKYSDYEHGEGLSESMQESIEADHESKVMPSKLLVIQIK